MLYLVISLTRKEGDGGSKCGQFQTTILVFGWKNTKPTKIIIQNLCFQLQNIK